MRVSIHALAPAHETIAVAPERGSAHHSGSIRDQPVRADISLKCRELGRGSTVPPGEPARERR